MSTSPILNIPYTYPVPKISNTNEPTGSNTTSTINNVLEKYINLFGELDSNEKINMFVDPNATTNKTQGAYQKINNTLLNQLYNILDNIKLQDKKGWYSILGSDSFYTKAQTFKIDDDEKTTYKIDKDHCREGYMAYRFYLKEIITRIKTISDYIEKGQNLIKALNELNSGSAAEINDIAHTYITHLEIYDKFIYEELEKFLTYYKYNEDTKQWEIIKLDVFKDINNTENNFTFTQLEYEKQVEGQTTTITYSYETCKQPKNYNWDGNKWIKSDTIDSKKPHITSCLQNLRELEVKTIKAKDDGSDGEGYIQLSTFNSLTLFDRLRYIQWYYKLMFSQTSGVDRTNNRFPDNYDTGYPCMPDVPSIDSTKATQSLGALEIFYIGYLINRDGPINALSSFFEVKVNALRNNVALSSKKIEALNIYLNFINSGLDQLNQNAGQRPSDGSIIALTYLCGQKMYNLLESKNGDKYFVIPSVVKNDQYFLVKADDSGKKWLIGDNGNDDNYRGNSTCYVKSNNNNNLWGATRDSSGTDFTITTISNSSKTFTQYPSGDTVTEQFTLPTQIECMTIDPKSVKNYSDALTKTLETKSDNNVLGSWTDAFSRKTQFINTTIDTINTDVTLDRSKIDTFDSLTSTFRSRAQDTYQNILSNIR